MKTGSHAPEIKGWCPGALRPMMSGDGLVVRVRPRGGRLTRAQARGIADLSARFGNGLIDLSARANVQLRGVSEAEHGSLIDGLRDLGLIDRSTEAEEQRNIIVTPFWSEGDGIVALVSSLTEALAAPDAPQTPGKFGYAVDCGKVPVLKDASADIRIERSAAGELIIRADGSDHGAPVTPETAAAMALALSRWFLDTGGATGGRGRMAAHLARGARLPEAYSARRAQPGDTAARAPGLLPHGFLVGFEFGQIQAETMSVLAQYGSLRITPWRMILIENVSALPAIPGLIADAFDPHLRVIACTGAPGCSQAHVATRPLARALCTSLAPGEMLHVSGCAKGCAHPGPSSLTLVGRPGGTFDLVRDGTAADLPYRRDLSAEALIRTPALLTE